MSSHTQTEIAQDCLHAVTLFACGLSTAPFFSIFKMNAFTKVVLPHLLGSCPVDRNMTFAVKANISCGHPASASTPSLRHWVPQSFSKVVRPLVDDGHQIVAITNMHELAFGITSENSAYGHVDNPRKSGYIVGGSSGGSAAAVAMNAVTFALGTDTGGSVRLPAALCGVVGYRPTIGLYDSSDVLPLSSTTDTIGILAQRVNTVQRVHRIIIPSYSPTTQQVQGKRIGVPRQYFYSVLDSEVSRVTETALQALKDAGAELVEADLPATTLSEFKTAFFGLVSYETNHLIPKYLKEKNAPVSYEELYEQISDPGVKQVLTNAKGITEEQCTIFQKEFDKIRQLYNDYFENNRLDCFVSPTTILPAVKRPTPNILEVNGKEFPTFIAYVHNALPQSGAGVPSISLPSGLTSNGLPVGLEVVTARGKDSELLDLAAAIEAVLPSLPQLSFEKFQTH